MLNKKSANGTVVDRVRAVGLETSKEIQHFGTVARLPIALDASICAASVDNLNQVLADTKTLADMYKKHHWQVSGPPSTSCTSCSTSTSLSRCSSWTLRPSASSRSAASPSPCRTTLPR